MANSILKISNIQLLNQFLHGCIDDIINRKPVNFDSYSNDIEWTKQDYAGAVDFIQNLYREISLSNNFEEFQSKIENFNSQTQQCIKDCYDTRKFDILQVIIKEHLSKTDKLVVENVDWKLKWIMGSSTLANLREPVVQLDLHCLKKENEKTRQTINFEMNLEQVNKLIDELEKAKNVLNKKIDQ